MVSQAKGGCKECGSKLHTAMYHNPKKPIQRSLIKKKVNVAKAPVKPKVKKITRSKLVKQMDEIFSIYIRLKDAKDGMATSVTCGTTKPWKEMQNGHFFTRGRQATRWHVMNCHVQDYHCNVALSGNYIKYTTYMIDRYGREAVDELERLSLSGKKISTPELRDMIEEYKEKVKQLLEETK